MDSFTYATHHGTIACNMIAYKPVAEKTKKNIFCVIWEYRVEVGGIDKMHAYTHEDLKIRGGRGN